MMHHWSWRIALLLGATVFAASPSTAQQGKSTAGKSNADEKKTARSESVGAAPTGFAAAAQSPTLVAMAWHAAAEAIGYRLYRAPSTAGPWTLLTTVEPMENWAADTSVSPASTYAYYIEAVYEKSTPGVSPAVSVTTPATANELGLTRLGDIVTPESSTTGSTGTTTLAITSDRSLTTSRTGISSVTAELAEAVSVAIVDKSAPTNLAAEYVGGGRWRIAWQPVQGATSYVVWVTSRGVSSALPPVSGPNLLTDALAPGGHGFQVVANYGPAPGTDPGPISSGINVETPRYSAKYRVTANGFYVSTESFDNPLETDGKRDEVYLRATIAEYSPKGERGAVRTVRSRTHGDVNHSRWSDPASPSLRFRAGSASSLGGLKTGDAFPSATPWVRNSDATYDYTFPALLWEGVLSEGGGSVQIVPVLYESDETPAPTDVGHAFVESLGPLLATGFEVPRRFTVAGQEFVSSQLVRALNHLDLPTDAEQLMQLVSRGITHASSAFGLSGSEVSSYIDPVLQQIPGTTQSFVSQASAAFDLARNANDREIGVRLSADGRLVFEPHVVNLTFETAEGAISGLAGAKAPGILELRFRDTAPGGTADYILFLEIRRVP